MRRKQRSVTVIKHLTILIMWGAFLLNSAPPSFAQVGNGLYDDLFSVSFADEKDGWACGRWGTVLHTSDGGSSWERQRSGTKYTLQSCHFVDRKNGWAVGDAGTILHTKDGGKTWEKQKSPVPYYLMDVFFVDRSRGWIVTERTHILYTKNGGKDWSVQYKDEDLILKGVSFSDARTGWAVGEFGYIYHTTDGGKKWTHQSGFFGFNGEEMDIVGDPFLFDVVAVDSEHVWAVGIEGYVTRSMDGGATWEKVDVGESLSHLFCVITDKKDTVFVGGKRAFQVSKDGGRTWSRPEFEPPIKYGWLYGIARRSGTNFTAVGSHGWIYNSNSVNSWHRITY